VLDGSPFALGTGQHTFYQADNSALVSVAVSPSGRLAATAASDGSVQLWDPASPAEPRELPGGHALGQAVAFSPDGKLVAALGGNCTTQLWATSTGTRLGSLTTTGAPPSLLGQVAFSPDGKTLATNCVAGPVSNPTDTARLWDPATLRLLATFRVSTGGDGVGMAFDPVGHTLALDNGSGTVLFWDTASHRVTGRIRTRQQGSNLVIAYRPDGKLLATAGPDRTIKFWRVPGGTLAGTLGPEATLTGDLAFSPDGTVLAGVGQNAVVRLWTVPARAPQRSTALAGLTLPIPAVPASGDPTSVNGVAFGPSGHTLISANSDGTAQVWDLRPAAAVSRICAALRGPDFLAQWRQVTSAPNPCPAPGNLGPTGGSHAR
jgi:WD40 repeat protein